MSIEQGQSECCPGDSCRPPRREFLRSAVLLGTAAIASRYIPVMAGPFARADFEHLVPADKKLAAQWVASLFDRGQATVYHGGELGLIGMPIGGITTGQLYLGGDGKLWHWDIFNQIKPTAAEHYTNPMYEYAPLDQGFTLKLSSAGVAQSHQLGYGGFAEISFRGEYPIGYVEYRDPACPIAVALAAFSPFIPLSVEDSSLPATLFQFTLTNTGSTAVAGELEGLLENAVARSVDECHSAARTNRVVREGQLLFLDCGATLSSLEAHPDAGTMGLALFSAGERDVGVASVPGRPAERPAGTLTRKFSLAPGASEVVTFAVVWRFPHLTIEGVHGGGGRHYATRFDSAAAVARYIDRNMERLYAETKLWHDTWYESSLPHWLLERTLSNISTLATSTAFRFADGRFYGSEGVGCCPGTCTHVWHYEQAMGRLFPQLDVLLRERTDFNPEISFMPDGMIQERGELHNIGDFTSESVPFGQAVDGQAGTILRALRDHQTSPDDAFLKRNWPAIKKAMQWLIAQDGNADGILEGAQHNTLDAEWYGPVSWLSGLYLAALGAAEEMALDTGDREFAARCRQIFETGQKNFVERLFNGEYFINRPDPKHPEAVNSGTGCEIDQVFGQSWAFQVGLGRVLPEKETRSALASLWRYNFTPDVGPYRAVNKPGRWYAMPGEAGLLMCTFPRSDWNFEQASGKGQQAGNAGYFNECMTGFEHQVAGHMIWEGMVMEGLAIERAIHDRYHASLRNPWNEIECGDHYARSMASYGVYIAACGFEYHGPKGYLGFAPRLKPENFKGAFTAAQGWGIFAQTIESGTQKATVDLKWGTLRLRTLSLRSPEKVTPTRVTITVNGHHVPAHLKLLDDRVHINLARDTHIKAGERITVELS